MRNCKHLDLVPAPVIEAVTRKGIIQMGFSGDRLLGYVKHEIDRQHNPKTEVAPPAHIRQIVAHVPGANI